MDQTTNMTVFMGQQVLVNGSTEDVLKVLKSRYELQDYSPVLVFEDATGNQMDFDLRGSMEEVLLRAGQSSSRSRGRPSLGVASREISLFPRHWEWLESQPRGVSATLRLLVEQERKRNPGAQERRRLQDAANRFLTAMAGNLPNYEEVTRALYADDHERLKILMADWPAGIRNFVHRLLQTI